ncbi:MAG: NAD(+) synthase [Anaerolineales bacterium]|nr:NAD(+) synthase [Anaerolineales bacterium]
MSKDVEKQTDKFTRAALEIDVEAEVNRIVETLRETVNNTMRRKGAVVGISGGIDSSVVLALCVRAFGPERVLGIQLPEMESSAENDPFAEELVARFGVDTLTEDITAGLKGLGCYTRRNEAIQRIFPQFDAGWSAKITLPGDLLERATLNIFSLTVTSPEGEDFTQRLPAAEYLQIVAASNFKQRLRSNMLYYHAELRNYAVIGTGNKNEHDLGFFVKYGDGGVDVQPIAHLFKAQVYMLAAYLDIPQNIRSRVPTTDTYPGGSTQEEFFYRIPFDILDTVWYGFERGVSQTEIAQALELEAEQVERIINDVVRKKRTTEYLRMPVVHLD